MKHYEVQFNARAVKDLDAIFCYIRDESSIEIAAGYIARIERLCFSLHAFPHRGTAIPGRIKSLRSIGFERRVSIVFKADQKIVEILRILYGGKSLPPKLLKPSV